MWSTVMIDLFDCCGSSQRFVGCCLVYDAHGRRSNRNGQSRLFGAITLWIERVCWSSVDLFITVSESIDFWYQTKLGPKKSLIVLNSPKVSKIDSGSDPNCLSLKDKFSLADDRLVFVYADFCLRAEALKFLTFSQQSSTEQIWCF